jgi:methylase of polypeptide subunit release factors
MVEHDYFGWTLRAEHLAELLPVAKEIQLDLYAYDFETLREEDLFGRLMAQLSRRSQRKLLGQEWTPNWLARQLAAKCLERIPQGEKPRVVDMCCGSGSILAEVIKQYLVIAPTASVADLSEVVTGFDIDPLAVMLAKTTWVFALASRLRGSTVEIAIPVYHADSLFASTPVSELPAPGSISDIAVELDGEIITLPAEFIAPEYRALFDDVVDWAYDEAQAAVKGDGEDLTEDIASVLLECLLSKHEMHPGESLKRKLASATFALAHRMAQLARANRNGIWAFILRNTYRPGLLAGQFNGLVSNPPWLAMSQLANNPYKQQLSKRSLLYGIKPSGASHLHLELATTFLIHAVDRYLAPGAAVACLLPGTIFKGHHQQKFRDAGYLTGPRQVALEINEVWNIEPGTFKVRSAAVIGVKKDAPFQVNRVVKAFTVRQGDIKDVPFVIARIGSRTAWVFGDLDVGHAQRDESAPGAVPPQGADLMPRTAVCIEILDKGGSEWRVNTPDRNSPWFFSVKDAKQLKGKNFPGFVAPQFIFRMAQSLNLLPFLCAGPFASIAIPAERAEAGGFKILSASQIRALGLRQTAIRFQHIDEAISRAQCGKPLADRIDERNKLSTQAFAKGQYLVLSGAGGEITCGACLAVDEFEDIVIDQTLYWKLVKTADEAWYRVGFLNSDALSDAIRTFNPEGEFGGRHLHTLPHRFTPPFDPEDATHRKIAELSKQVSGLVGDLIAQHSEIGNAEKTIASRRRKLRGLLRLLPEVVELEELCFTAITGHQPSQAAL